MPRYPVSTKRSCACWSGLREDEPTSVRGLVTMLGFTSTVDNCFASDSVETRAEGGILPFDGHGTAGTRELALPENQVVIPLPINAGRGVSEVLTAGMEVVNVSGLVSGVPPWGAGSGSD